VVRARHGIPGPVRRLGLVKDDAGVAVALIRVAPDIEITRGRACRRPPRRLKPRVRIGGMVDDELRDDPQTPAMGGVEESLEIVERAVAWIDQRVVRDGVAGIT